jgi:hypothetical protein
MRWVHPKFPLLKTLQKQYTQTFANKSFENGVYIMLMHTAQWIKK